MGDAPRRPAHDDRRLGEGGVEAAADGQLELVRALIERDLRRERPDRRDGELARLPRHDERPPVGDPQARYRRVIVDPHGAPRLQRDGVRGVVERQDGDGALDDGLRPDRLADRRLSRPRQDEPLVGAGRRLDVDDVGGDNGVEAERGRVLGVGGGSKANDFLWGFPFLNPFPIGPSITGLTNQVSYICRVKAIG